MFQPHLTSNSTEALDELRALLRPIGDDFQRCAELFVIVGKPFEQRTALSHFHFYLRLQCESSSTSLGPNERSC